MGCKDELMFVCWSFVHDYRGLFFVCHGLGGGRKLKPLIGIQNVKLFPFCKFSRVLLMTSENQDLMGNI